MQLSMLGGRAGCGFVVDYSGADGADEIGVVGRWSGSVGRDGRRGNSDDTEKKEQGLEERGSKEESTKTDQTAAAVAGQARDERA